MQDSDTTEATRLASHGSRRPPIARTVVLLILAGAGLVVLILVTGDFRRSRLALDRGVEAAELLQARVGERGLLPRNLTPYEGPPPANEAFPMTGTDDAQARHLRGVPGPVLAARTKRIRQFLGTDGRVVVIFQDGRFRAEWVSESKYRTWSTDQRRTAERRAERPDGS